MEKADKGVTNLRTWFGNTADLDFLTNEVLNALYNPDKLARDESIRQIRDLSIWFDQIEERLVLTENGGFCEWMISPRIICSGESDGKRIYLDLVYQNGQGGRAYLCDVPQTFIGPVDRDARNSFGIRR